MGPPAPAVGSAEHLGSRNLFVGIVAAGALMIAGVGWLFVSAGDKSNGGASPSAVASVSSTPTASISSPPSSTSPSVEPTSSPSSSGTTLVLGPTCSNDMFGYQISYPQGWYASEGADLGCEFFDPEPVRIDLYTEIYGIAVTILPPYERYGRTVSSFVDPQFTRVVSLRQSTVGGQRASLIENEATGNGFDPKGTMTYAYVVNVGGYGLVLLTSGVPGVEYDTNKQVVDLMAGSMSFFA